MTSATTSAGGVGASAPTLALRGISKRFGPVQALEDVSMSFRAGEVTGLLGENGAGKSTLLRILSGDHQPDDGAVYLDGERVQLRSPRDAHALGIHVVYQEPELVPHLSVAENLVIGAIPARRHAVRPAEIIRVAADLIAEYGFAETLDPTAIVADCSQAQRQCIEILKAVRDGAKVLCLDEPTSALSDDEAQRLWRVMERLREQGTALVYVSHRMSEISALCQQLAIMRDGRVVAEQAAAATTEADMIRLMVGRELSAMFPERERSAGDVVLRMRGVTTASVADITFDLRAGEILGLSGLVGAGRSEVAEALYGATPVLRGEIEIEGTVRRMASPKAAISAGIGLAPEDRKHQGLFLDRSVSDNVSLSVLARLSRFHIVHRAREHELVQAMTQRMRVKTASLDAPVRTLSGGNAQKVLLARWVARNPRILILDEPTRGIDVGAKAEIYHLIDELTRSGMAVILISSELPELLGLADRILVMREGRIVGETPAADASEESLLRLALGAGKEAA